MSLFRTAIDKLKAYEPGEQPLPGTKTIKLNTNENPYPPSPWVVKEIGNIDAEALRRYPDPMSTVARQEASRLYDVPLDFVLAANGSDEILAYIARACLEPGRSLVYPVPTYLLYPVLGGMQDCPLVEVPFDDDFNLPVEKLIEANGAVTVVCSPNNPDASSALNSDLETLAENLKGLLVIDEAYCDFADHNAMGLVKKYNNVIVLRTLSKGYSLAGLRLGFGIADPRVLQGLLKVKDSYNVSAMAIRIGAAALRDQAYLKETTAKVLKTRGVLAGKLAGIGFKVWPSEANYIFVRPPDGNADVLFQYLRRRGILVRHFNKPGIKDKLRISIGTPEEIEVLLGEIRQFLERRC